MLPLPLRYGAASAACCITMSAHHEFWRMFGAMSSATTPRSRLGEKHSGFVPVAGVDKALQLRISEHRLKVAGGACARRAMQLLILLGRRHRCSAAANPGRIITGSARELALGRHVLCLTLLLASAAVRRSSYSLPAPRVRTNLACRLDTASSINMSAPASRFPPGSVVAVTGANGFIGSHIVKQLLAKGYRVRAVVRDPTNASKVAHLKTFPHSEHVELAKGELNEADYQKAFAGAHAVIHTATPYMYSAPDPDRDIVQPAIAGAFICRRFYLIWRCRNPRCLARGCGQQGAARGDHQLRRRLHSLPRP